MGLAARAERWRRTILAAGACAWLLACGGSDVVLGNGRDASSTPAPRDPAPAGMDAAADPDATADPDAATSRDAGPRPVPQFGEPQVIAAISSEGTTDDDPSLSSDRLLLFFNSMRDGGLGREDIWWSARDALDGDWQTPQTVAELNSEERETGIALAGDGLLLWFSSDRDGGQGGLDVYASSRASLDAAWSAPEPVAAVNSTGDDLVSAVSNDGRTLLLARRDDDDDDYDLYAAVRDDSGTFAPPTPIAELNSDDEESDGFLLASGLQLIFTRDEDLFLAERTTPNEPFGPPAELTTLNSDDDDRDAWSSDDFRDVIFSSDRSGSYLLYEAMR
jgi:hypothetical protein